MTLTSHDVDRKAVVHGMPDASTPDNGGHSDSYHGAQPKSPAGIDTSFIHRPEQYPHHGAEKYAAPQGKYSNVWQKQMPLYHSN